MFDIDISWYLYCRYPRLALPRLATFVVVVRWVKRRAWKKQRQLRRSKKEKNNVFLLFNRILWFVDDWHRTINIGLWKVISWLGIHDGFPLARLTEWRSEPFDLLFVYFFFLFFRFECRCWLLTSNETLWNRISSNWEENNKRKKSWTLQNSWQLRISHTANNNREHCTMTINQWIQRCNAIWGRFRNHQFWFVHYSGIVFPIAAGRCFKCLRREMHIFRWNEADFYRRKGDE